MVGTYMLFAVENVIAIIFVVFCFKETKHLTPRQKLALYLPKKIIEEEEAAF